MAGKTKEKLLTAAVGEFAEHGYAAATVRGIVARAGERNLNAIVYYFGGKEELYKTVLDFMFREAEKFKEARGPNPPELADAGARLEAMIRFLCRAYYSMQTRLDRDLYRIFVREAGDPSLHFMEMVRLHLSPGRERLCSLLREHLGPDVPQGVVDDCEYSISGQILYGALGRAIISGTHPGRVPFEEYVEQLAGHIAAFTMAGLEAFKAR